MSNILPKEITDCISEKKILYNENMDRHTLIQTGGKATALIMPTDIAELKLLLELLHIQKNVFIMGNGSSTVVSDLGYRGIVIKTGNLKKIYSYGEYLTATCGDKMQEISEFAYKSGLSGLEWGLSCVSTLGGILNTNIGCMKSCLYVIEVITNTGNIVTLKAEDIFFSGKKTGIKQKKYTVVRAIFKLNRTDRQIIYDEMRNNRPQTGVQAFNKEYADLIQECGFSSFSAGGAAVKTDNPCCIINKGGATSADVHKLVCSIILGVYEKSGMQIHSGIKFLGKFTS